MFSKWRDRLRHTVAFRLAFWYTTLFVASSIALVALTHVLLASSLQERDRELIAAALERYAAEYARLGLPGLDRAIASDRVAGRHERLLVRVLGRRENALFVTMPADWTDFDLAGLDDAARRSPDAWTTLPAERGAAVLEVASLRLADDTLVQVGKSSDNRIELLERFRTAALAGLGTILVVGLVGGVALTSWTLRPVRDLVAVVQGILRTGRITARVPVRKTGDALDELGTLFNGMLDRIESLMSAMRGSLDNVAHDLRTPMTRLRGVAETALREPREPDEYREALADCVEESDRVVGMLDTLMDISEAETGSMRLQVEAVEVGMLVREVLDLYADVADDGGVLLEADIPADLPVAVDTNRMRQVLANLVDNAVKYTPRGGRVTLRAGHEDGGVVLRVTDTGVGIAPDELPRIWDRLYRGDQSRTARGLGLGLSLVRAIVSAHRGRADVCSTLGSGTTVTLWLPPAAPPDVPVNT